MHAVQNKKCEKCSMIVTYMESIDSIAHHYCEHHKTEKSVKILDIGSQSTLKKLLPLFSIFGVIALLTLTTITFKQDLGFMSAMMYMMAYFFLVFGVFKLINLRGFADAYMTYDLVAMRSRVYALAYPFIEVALGLFYLFSLGGVYRDVFTFLVMTIGTIGVWKALQKKGEIPCACLGTVFSVPMTKVTLFENLFMALMALYMVFTAIAGGHVGM